MATRFYNPHYLMEMKDANGETPEIFITLGNRGSGKTFNIAKEILIKEYILNDKKIGLLTRIKDDLGKGVADGIFKEVLNIYGEDLFGCAVTCEEVSRGKYSDIYFLIGSGENRERRHIGYVLPINRAASNLKQISSLFADIAILFMDEFQTDNYVPNEVGQFINLHQTVARGGGKAVRYCPVILASNFINLLNPYFTALGLHRMQAGTKKYRGDGVVVEMFLNEDVRKEQMASGFNRAFAGHEMLTSSNDNVWLEGNNSLIEKPTEEWGNSYYVCTLSNGDKKFGVRRYPCSGFYYVNRSIDSSCQYSYNVTIDGNLNLPLLKSSALMKTFRDAFREGRVRVSDAECKEMMLNIFI